jgi:hypothetical protein
MTREFSTAAFRMGHSEVSDTQEDFDANGNVKRSSRCEGSKTQDLNALMTVSTAAICALTRASMGKGFGVSVV